MALERYSFGCDGPGICRTTPEQWTMDTKQPRAATQDRDIMDTATIGRPMKIEIVVDPSRPAPPATLASRVAPAPAANGAASSTPRASAPRGRGAGGRRGRGGGRAPKAERTTKTAADLDAEMEDYTASNAPATA
ncbi:hypothetical protein K438DRAFT_925146 [Mycena galopus ATCC 62051]|nr:hypothetical protein K438DRAFT_925146 [Mycena galopus ATCC 62051]